MPYSDSTQQYQRMLASYTRTGIETNIPNVKEEGIARYRKMIYNVVDDSLSTAYPLTKKLLSTEEWNSTVHQYFSAHACQSPYLWRMPLEFYEYVKEQKTGLLNAYPFLSDLLLFEWAEIEVFMMEDIDLNYTEYGNIEDDALVLNPACLLQYFQYPVYIKKPEEITEENKAHYFMLTHRHPESNAVGFLEVSPMFARMIEILSESSQSIDQLIGQFSEECGLQIDSTKKNEIIRFFKTCIEKRIILGYNKTN